MTLLAVTIGWVEVYLFCLLAGLVFAVVTGVFSGLAGHDASVGHDIGGHGGDVGGHDGDLGGHGAAGLTDSSIHFSPLSPVVVAMFVTVFGGMGLAGATGMHLPWPVHLPLATVSGLAFAGATFAAFAKVVLWAQGSSQASVTEAMGGLAEVIIPIPPDGVGKVTYTLRDRRFTASARSVDGRPIAAHAMVIITNISGSTLLVCQSDDELLLHLGPDSQAGPQRDPTGTDTKGRAT